jgi:nitrous oxidase accessory protein NosD
MTIQSAVNAANPGDVIRVCADTYAEQVTISTPVTLRADNGVVVMPSGMIQNATDVSGSGAIVAVFVVNGVQGVDIEGFIVDGSSNGITACSPQLVGILYQNSTGHIRHNAVRHMILGPSDNGCQSGNGIEVETASGMSSNVTISENSVWDYQKDGIAALDAGTQASVNGNVVSGIGPTTGAAANGIEVSYGASGSVTKNTVTDNIWSPCVSPTVCSANGSGILIFQSDTIFVGNNSFATNQVGIYVIGNSSKIVSNEVSNSVTLIGVALVGNNNAARRNVIFHSDQAGVYVQGNSNSVFENQITDATAGVLVVSGSTGNNIHGNSFFADGATVQDPAVARPMTARPLR